MKPLQLMKELDGFILANKIRATVDGKVVILARLHGDKWVMTDDGAKLAGAANATKDVSGNTIEPKNTKGKQKTK